MKSAIATIFPMLAALILSSCGGADSASPDSATADCPPVKKGNGVMVSSRYDLEELQAANRWRTEMYDASCAGALAGLVPDLPDGFGVMPTHRPFIMNDDQIHVGYATLPDPLYLEDDVANVPQDLETIEYEIVRYSAEEMSTVRSWMEQNPNAYLSGELEGQPVYLIGGFGTGRPGKGDRLATSLHAFPGDNLVVRISHKSLFSQRGDLELSPLVRTVLSDILDGVDA